MKKKVISAAFTFEGWDFKTWIRGSKRAIVAILGIILVKGTELSPDIAFSIATLGLTADRLWALIEYFIKEK